MVVENYWFAGVISTPLYMATFLTINFITNNLLAYIIISIIVLGISGVIYQHVVVKRASIGVSQFMVSAQWVVGQLVIIGGLYVAKVLF